MVTSVGCFLEKRLSCKVRVRGGRQGRLQKGVES